jgi:hypothetical protein
VARIIVSVLVVCIAYRVSKLIYRLRDVFLLTGLRRQASP